MEIYKSMNTERLEVPISAVPKRPRFRLLTNRFRRFFATANAHKVHFVYLVPADKEPLAETDIGKTAIHLQRWYRWQMGNGKTFSLHDPIVETFRTPYPATWYSTSVNGDYAAWFWNNVLYELSAQIGGGFWQEFDDWVVYIEAEPAPGQYAGGTSGGYISGVCVLGAKDCASVRGIDPDWTQCRGIGGGGHELGHTFGLPHPVTAPPTVWERALMGIGYLIYPDAILTPEAKDQLNQNPFFAETVAPKGRPKPCPFDDGHGRTDPVQGSSPAPPARP